MRFQTIPEVVGWWASREPTLASIEGLDRSSLTYAELAAHTEEVGQTLNSNGVGRSDVVAICLPNGPEMATAFLSVASVSAAAPLNPTLTKSELAYYMSDLHTSAAIVLEDDPTSCSGAAQELGIPVFRVRPKHGVAGVFSLHPESSRPPERPARAIGNDVALYLHTSGTTSRPKIVPLSHASLCHSAANVAATLRLGPEDRCMNVMPLFHIHGLVAALMSSLVAAASVACTPGYLAPRFYDWLSQLRPTWYTAVPTMHQGILSRFDPEAEEIVRNGRLRLVRSSSASLPSGLLCDLEKALGVPVIEAYGMTEAAHQMTSNPLPPGKRKPGSVGPAAGPEVAVADEDGNPVGSKVVGEVIIRGASVIASYHGLEREDHFHGDGWFRTGDQAYLDEDGYLFLTGRLKEMINRGGESIAPREIDEAMLHHPDIQHAVAFAVPDEQLGEEVAAAVVLVSGSSANEAGILNFLSKRLSFAKLPKRVVFLDELPKGPTGKVQRIGLAKRLGLEKHVAQEMAAGEGLGAATDETVRKIRELWCTVLAIEDVNPDVDFTAAGGDSITAAELLNRIRATFGLEISLIDLYTASTIRRQSTLVDGLRMRRPATEKQGQQIVQHAGPEHL